MGVEPALPRHLLQEDQQEPYGRRLPYVSRAQLLDVTDCHTPLQYVYSKRLTRVSLLGVRITALRLCVRE